MKYTVIKIALEPTKWQKFLDKTGFKRFTYNEIVISLKNGKNFYDRPNSKIRMVRIE
jgi:hypothetical protein